MSSASVGVSAPGAASSALPLVVLAVGEKGQKAAAAAAVGAVPSPSPPSALPGHHGSLWDPAACSLVLQLAGQGWALQS